MQAILQNFNYSEEKISALHKGLSTARLARYANLSPHSKAKQLELYVWNTALSESLYTPIQGLEIITRNYFHEKLTDNFGAWWNNIAFSKAQEQAILQTLEQLKKGDKLLTANNVVANLSFGFWTGLLGSHYEGLWRSCLYKAFLNKPTPFLRKEAHKQFDLIRLLRNRIAHHEPILRADLPNHYDRILKMIGWFCEESAEWVASQTKFLSIWSLPVNPFFLGGLVPTPTNPFHHRNSPLER